jgi:hypothetical protein
MHQMVVLRAMQVSPFLQITSIVLGTWACSSDDSLSSPRGPSDLGIATVQAVSSEPVTTSGGSLNLDCSEPLLVSIAPKIDQATAYPYDGFLGGFRLEPPGGCSDETNCGWMVLFVDDEAEPRVEGITSPLQLDPLSGSWQSGLRSLRVELRDAWNQPVRTDANEVLSGSFEVNLVCTAP